jgi:disulfide bond formation protein DsbB
MAKRITGLVRFLQQYGAYLIFVTALSAMLGSLYYSEIRGFYPCTLCWYQRILMYPLTIIILVGIIKQDEYLPSYVLPFSILGMFLSFYHYMLQLGIITSSAGCSSLSCSSRYVNYFGFVTIPLMALIAFVIINIITSAIYWVYNQQAKN